MAPVIASTPPPTSASPEVPDELYQKINVRQCVPAQAEGLLHVPDHQTCYMAIAVHTGPLADGAGIAVHSGLYDPAAFPFPDGRNIGIGPRVLFRGEDRASGKQGLHHLLLLRCGVCGRGGSHGIPSHYQDQAGKQQGTGTDQAALLPSSKASFPLRRAEQAGGREALQQPGRGIHQ